MHNNIFSFNEIRKFEVHIISIIASNILTFATLSNKKMY